MHSKSFVFVKFAHGYSDSVVETAKRIIFQIIIYSLIKPLGRNENYQHIFTREKTTFKDDQVVYKSNTQTCSLD